ncbi:MAG: leucine-rich repeat protein, partial [Bacilli bacterium]
MKTRKICLMLGILIISVFYVTPNQLKAADNTQADIIDKYVLKDGLEIDKINSINGEDKTTSNVKDGTSKIVQNSLVSTVGEVGSIVAVNIVNNGIKNLACSFTVLEKSENGNFGTVQVGEGDFQYAAIDRSTAGTIEIPNEISLASGAKYKVTSISEFAFYNCTSLTNTGLAKNTTITSIEANAFKGCSSLKSTELETNTVITKLGGCAFQYCSSLKSTGLAKNTTITSIDPGIFAGCSSLTSTGLETNTAIDYIGSSMFEKCTSLTSTGLETNTSVTRLGWKVFLGCSSLTSTGLGTNKDITYLEDNTFAFCASLTSTGLETNKGIKGLGNYAFKGCNSITSTGLETNTTITRLMNSVFEGCGSLTNTGLGTNTTITKIGGRAFFGDTKIKNIVFLIDQLPAMKSDTFSNTNVEIYYLPEVTIKPTIASTGAKAVHELSVQNIILKNKASKLNYIEGQEFEPSGLELTVNYDMGHKRVIKYDDTTKANFSFDKTVLSLKDTEITVTYCGKPATLPITVVKKKLIKTEVKRNIDKVDYIEEETFDPRGLELELTYDNGKSEVIKYDDTTKTKFTFDKTVLSLK